MRREQKAEKRRKERPEQSRARAFNSRKRKEREREKVHVGFLLPFFFFSSLRVLLWLTFSLFFAQIWVHKLKLSRVSRKERFLRDIKFKLWNNKRYITVTLRGVLERERENKKKNFSRERDWSC
jgi:hypothetical protein